MKCSIDINLVFFFFYFRKVSFEDPPGLFLCKWKTVYYVMLYLPRTYRSVIWSLQVPLKLSLKHPYDKLINLPVLNA